MQTLAQPSAKQSLADRRVAQEPAATTTLEWDQPEIATRQTCPCGGGCPKCSPNAAPQFVLSPTHSPHEREADDFADGRNTRLSPAAADGLSLSPVAAAAVERSLGSSSARPLPPIASSLPVQPDSIRVHTGAHAAVAADVLHARAFTTGRDIVFGAHEFAPETRAGRALIAHEVAHIAQQRAARPQPARLVQRQVKTEEKKEGQEEAEEVVLIDEPPKYRWINYAEAARMNRKWFELLELRGVEPFGEINPFDTPNAFTNRVTAWQTAVHRPMGDTSFAQFVFAASEQQGKVREPSTDTILTGLDKVAADMREQHFEPGRDIGVDGILGPGTLWTMLVAQALAMDPKSLEVLKKGRIPVDMLKFTVSDPGSLPVAIRATHAFEFNRPHFKASWTTIAQAGTIIDTFEAIFSDLPAADSSFLTGKFFEDGKLPDTPPMDTADLLAILARGYEGQALPVLASILQVDRRYIANTDIELLELMKTPEWRYDLDLRMAANEWAVAEKIIHNLNLEPPETPQVKAALSQLEKDDGNPAPNRPMTFLVVAGRLPEKSDDFWHETAQKYVADKIALANAADAATKDYMAQMNKTFETRMAGEPDIRKADAPAFMELLAGDAFTFAQDHQVSLNSDAVEGVRIEQKTQEAVAGDQVARLYALAQQKLFLVVQLGDDQKERFPLSLRQIDESRASAWKNGKQPLMFDLIGTPHAAFHGYPPQRFTARKTERGAEVGLGRYELSEAKDALSYEDWKFRIAYPYGNFEPVLVEVNEFNPDAGFLTRGYRQWFGTDKIRANYFWTCGGSLPGLSDQLWSAQTKVNLIDWFDSALTVVALAELVAAPLVAPLEVEGSSAVAKLGEQAIAAEIRREVLKAVLKFVFSEALGQVLNWATDYVMNSKDISEEDKEAWNGLMVVLMIYGATQLVRSGFRAFRKLGTASFRAEIETLEKELETGVATSKAELSGPRDAAEAAAEAEVEKLTAEKFQHETGGEPGGAGRVRSDDPRAAGVSAKTEEKLTAGDRADLRKAMGDKLADAFEAKTDDVAHQRLARIKEPAAIRKLAESFKPKELARILASVDNDTLGAFARELDKEVLSKLLKSLVGKSGKTTGVSLMRAFAVQPRRLAVLFKSLGAERLLSLAESPGAERIFQVSAPVDPEILGEAIKNIRRRGETQRGSLQRFRNLLEATGPERTAEVLNTYTPGQIRQYMEAGEGLSPAQRVAALAIRREGEPTVYRRNLGAVPDLSEARPTHFEAKDFGTFVAIGPEAKLPGRVRRMLATVQTATALAATRLEEVLDRAAKGALTPEDLKVLPEKALKAVKAFNKAPKATRDAAYGTALQYLTEQELLREFGGNLPDGMAFRESEIRAGSEVFPDFQLTLELKDDLRFPARNKTERVIFDWTTRGQAGKIGKYAGGTPPVSWGVEIIQPGPPPAVAPPARIVPIAPGVVPAPPRIDVPPPPEHPDQVDTAAEIFDSADAGSD